MGKLSAKICMPFGAETMENDPCTVETTRNYNAGTGTRQDTSAQVKERNRQAFQRRIAQQKSRIHAAEPNTFKFSGAEQLKFAGAEQKTSGISGDEPQLRAALADLEEMKVLMARITASLYALQFPVQAPRCPQLPRDDTFAMPPTMAPALADLIANLARERSSAHSWPEEEIHNDIGALAAHRVGEMILCDDDGPNYFSSEEVGADGVASGYWPSPRVEGRDGAEVGSVASDVGPSEGAAWRDGAVVGSVASVVGPSEGRVTRESVAMPHVHERHPSK